MKRYRFALIFTAATLSFALLLGMLLRGEVTRSGRTQMNISVVLYGDSTERWTSLEQGIRQASGLLDVQTPLVNVAGEHDPEAQIRLLEREVEAGAQGLIIAASDSQALADYLATLPEHIVVVFVETGAGAGFELVGPDNAEMGRALGESLLADLAPGAGVTILGDNLERDSVRARYDALTALLSEQGIAWNSEYTAALWALKAPHLAGTTTLVALDTETLENAIDAAQIAAGPVKLYGIGGSEKIVYELERGHVTRICYPNEFNAGYAAMMQVAKGLGRRDADVLDHGSGFVVVDAENLYDPDTERLLFPIIQ